MPKKFLIILIGFTMLFASNSLSHAQNLGGDFPRVPLPSKLVDFPTAATLPRASFNVELDAFSNGGLLSMISIGLHKRFMIGISYGGEGVLGNEKADWFERPEYMVKLMLIDENLGFPAVALGFESQGHGFYDDVLNRYRFKAPGFYLAVSKGYQTFNWVSGIHAGINMNPIEDDGDGDDDFSFYGGFDITFNNNLTILGEYQGALNDDKSGSGYGRGRGYLNAGFKWTFSNKLELAAILKDLLNNTRGISSITRELRITYMERF
jgi:hypothetical protein